ncbi:hypothetical protein DAQ1742_00645 [Dickeya aquatica]|uniref:Uncharacterized protein n=1 Tax=Dickeya aquatica TaxID=1401087 RepID=A0A375A6T8_9GAMM|nr:hypothetical protein DAQ1742_00645 [Dickeya aquatica]
MRFLASPLPKFSYNSLTPQEGIVDYCLWDKHKAFYFKAIQAGVSGNYSPMMQLVSDILPN